MALKVPISVTTIIEKLLIHPAHNEAAAATVITSLSSPSSFSGSRSPALLSCRARLQSLRGTLTEEEVQYLVLESRHIFMSQPMLVEIAAPVKLCGDIHGQYTDLLRLFELGGYPPESNYMFLGDYVDRGRQSLECICLLLAYKVHYPENFFLLRGNHECSSINKVYGFFDECKRRYSVKTWKLFTDTFNCMPVAGLVEDRILCMHGGISPEIVDLDSIRHILRPTDVPDTGLICDLLWADPEPGVAGWYENDRGVSYTFGEDVLRNFLDTHELDMVCRAHQVVQEGYEFFADRCLVTLFSAPNYCGEFDNSAAIMAVSEDLVCSMLQIYPECQQQPSQLLTTDHPAPGVNVITASSSHKDPENLENRIQTPEGDCSHNSEMLLQPSSNTNTNGMTLVNRAKASDLHASSVTNADAGLRHSRHGGIHVEVAVPATDDDTTQEDHVDVDGTPIKEKGIPSPRRLLNEKMLLECYKQAVNNSPEEAVMYQAALKELDDMPWQ